jgi:WD40 repeat protein
LSSIDVKFTIAVRCRSFARPLPEGTDGVAFGPDGKRIARCGNDDSVKMPTRPAETDATEVTMRSLLAIATVVPMMVSNVPLTPGQEAKRSWGGKEVASFRSSWNAYSVAVSPDGKRIYAGNYGGYLDNDPIYVIDVATGKSTSQFWMSLRLFTIALSHDGKRLALAGSRGVRVFDTADAKQVFEIKNGGKAFTNESRAVAFSADGKRLVVGGGDWTKRRPGDLKVRDAATGKVLLDLKGHEDYVLSVAMSKDGQRIVSGCRDATAKVWDAATGKELLTLKGHTVMIHSVALSPDGKRIVTAGGGRFIVEKGVASIKHDDAGDGEIRVWDAASGKSLFELSGQKHRVQSATFSPDGKLIAAGGWDTTLSVWDAQTGRRRATLRAKTPVTVNSVTFTHDGNRLVSGGDDGRVSVWELEN